MAKVNSIRGLVYDKFKSIRELAIVLGWSPAKAGRIVNNPEHATILDFQQLLSALGIEDAQEIRDIFLSLRPTKEC